MEGNFAYEVMHTSPIALVGILALIFAGMLLVVCIAERVPAYLYIRHTFLYLPILAGTCMVSVGAWQYVAAALSFWPLVLTATPLEAILGYYCFKVAKGDQKQEGSKLLYRFLYYPSLLLLMTLGGAYVWGKGMQLISGSIPMTVFLVVWMVLLILALIVGKVAWQCTKGGFTPIYVHLQTRPVVELAVNIEVADPRLPESISEGVLRSRFWKLAELLQAEDQPVTKEVLLRLHQQHYGERDRLRTQKEIEKKEAAQAQDRKLKEERLTQDELEKAARGAIATALEIIKGRTTIPPNERSCELYEKRLTSLADELKHKGQMLTSDHLLERYDERWGRDRMVSFVRTGGGRR